jgi:hypothetical protein
MVTNQSLKEFEFVPAPDFTSIGSFDPHGGTGQRILDVSGGVPLI